MSDAIPVITYDLDKACTECAGMGAADNGLCMSCIADAMAGKALKTEAGREIAKRMHNLKPEEKTMSKAAFAKDSLKSFINRIERLNEEREALNADIKEVFSEAKGTGFDTKIMRMVIRMRKLDKADFQEQEAVLDLYLTAMDMR